MAKQKKKNQKSKKKCNCYVAVGIIVLIFLAIAVGAYVHASKSQTRERSWLQDNCKCCEWQGAKYCQKGYELNNGLCVSPMNYTNPATSCSKYNCDGRTYLPID